MRVLRKLAGALGCMALIAVVALGRAQQVTLKAIPNHATDRIGWFQPKRSGLASDADSKIKVPGSLIRPSFGSMRFQNTTFGVVIDHPPMGDYKIYVDANSNRDFTDDPPISVVKSSVAYATGNVTFYKATAEIELFLAGKRMPVSVCLYVFDQADPQVERQRNSFFYYPDFAEEGKFKFGNETLSFLISDPEAAADSLLSKQAQLFVDRRGDQKFTLPEDHYSANTAFNINGQTVQINRASFVEGSVTIGPAQLSVPEVKLPPSFVRGKIAASFRSQTLKGAAVAFPSTYRGKLVLLDFWATWCVPCMKEMPNVVKNYREYHEAGLEILGVSVDADSTSPKISQVTSAHQMTWPEICEANGKEARLARLFGVNSIPHAFLVDGDTGKIVAEGTELRGEGLGRILSRFYGQQRRERSVARE